jgi:hypothetical protein
MRGADARHDTVRPGAGLVARRLARPDRRQAFHRRRGRQGEPDAGADRGRLRCRGADDQRPGPGSYRRHSGQDAEPARLRHRAVAPSADRHPAPGRLRHRRSHLAPGTCRSAAVCRSRCHGHGGVGSADHGQHPVQEAGRRSAGPRDGREGGQRRVLPDAKGGAHPGREPGGRGPPCRPAHACHGHRHELGARPHRRQCAGDERGGGLSRRTRASRCPPGGRDDGPGRGDAAARESGSRSRTAASMARLALDSGEAAERFSRMVASLGRARRRVRHGPALPGQGAGGHAAERDAAGIRGRDGHAGGGPGRGRPRRRPARGQRHGGPDGGPVRRAAGGHARSTPTAGSTTRRPAATSHWQT